MAQYRHINPENSKSGYGACQYYKVGDKIESIRTDYGAWFSADIIDIRTDTTCRMKNCQCSFRIVFEGDDESDGETSIRDITQIREVSYLSIKWEYLKPGMKVVINRNIDNPEKWGYWYDCIIDDVQKQGQIFYMEGTVMVGYDGLHGKFPVEFNSESTADVLEIRPHALLADKDSSDYETGVKPEYCLRCKNKPKLKCKKCCCCKCGLKVDFHLTVQCDECCDWYHTYCLVPPLNELPNENDEEDWYCPNCNNESRRQKIESRLKSKRKGGERGKKGRIHRKLTTPTKSREASSRTKPDSSPKTPLKRAVEEEEKLLKDISKNCGIKKEVEKLYPDYKIIRIWVEIEEKPKVVNDPEKEVEEDKKEKEKEEDPQILALGLQKYISFDTVNEHLWREADESLSEGQVAYLGHVRRLFTCPICCELLKQPITLSCKHSFCMKCFFRSLGVNVYHCAVCRTDVIHTEHYVVNENLNAALNILFKSPSKKDC